MAYEDLPELRPKPSEEDKSTTSRREYYGRLNNWCDSAVEEGQALQQDIPELREIANALDYLVGMQWKEAMPSYRVKPVSNEFLSMFWETIGLLTDIRPVFHIADIANDGGYSEIEKILNNIAKGWVSTSQFERRYGFCMMFGMLTSAPSKLYWNPFARGTSGDPSDYDLTFEALSPSSIMRLGMGETIQDDECLVYRKVRTLAWIRRAYPTMGKYVEAEESKSRYTVDVQSPIGVSPQLYPPLSPGMKRLLGAGDKTSFESNFPKAELQEFWRKDDSVNDGRNKVWVGPEGASWGYWVEPGKKLYPRGRVFVRANGIMLYDQCNPYFHRQKPFQMLGLYGVPWQDYAMSVVSPWMKQQDILNQMMAGMLQTVKKAVNPALMAAKSAINPAAMKAIDSSKPGLKITYSQNAPHPPAWQTPPVLPTYVLQIYTQILQSMKQSSGASAIGDALSKKQVPSGDSLEKITFSKNTPIRVMSRSGEFFLDDVGQQWAADALQFYGPERRMELLGPAGLAKEDMDEKPGTLIPDGIDSESFVRRYHWMTEKGSLLNAQHQEKIPIVMGLRKLKDLSRKQLFKFLNWNINQKENDEELKAEMEAQAQAMAAAGGGKGHK
jgi:hypothetical protein